MKKITLGILLLSISGLTTPRAHAFGERQWYACECQASQSCVLGTKLETGLSKDPETGKVTDYTVALKVTPQTEDLGIWDPTYFADDIRFDHRINGFERQQSVSLILESEFSKKESPLLKAQKDSRSSDYLCRKI